MDSLRSSYVIRVRRRGRMKWALSYIGPDSRRHKEMTAAPSREAAKLLLAQKVRELIEHKVSGVPARPSITVADFAKKFLEHQQAALEPASYDRERAVVNGFLVPELGKRKLDEVHPRDIQEYLNRRAATVYHRKNGTTKKIAPGTVQRELISIQGFFSRAVDWEYLDRSPVRGVRIRKYEWRKQRILSLEEQERLFDAFGLNPRREYLGGIVTLALHTGMREGELLRLTWSDVDFAGGRLIVRSTNENPNKGKRTRTIAMSTKVRAVLLRLMADAERQTEGTADISGRFVFTNPRTATRYVDTKLGWYASLKDARITGFRFHDLRHTFATRAIQGGCKLPALQQVLGHADITTTMRYVHMLGIDLNEVIDCVEAFEDKRGGVKARMEAALG